MNINAVLAQTCTVSITAVDFGSYGGTVGVAANGDVTVNCTFGIPYNITMDAGLHFGGGGVQARWVSDGAGNYIDYGLYKESAFNFLWGDSDFANTNPNGSSLADTGSGADQPHTVYGWLSSPSPGTPAGAFSDTVNVTVHY
jgi:spore coat protein U-like protein